MPKTTQTFENHRRWFPIYHFVALPILWIYFAHSLVHTYQDFDAVHVLETLWVFAIALAPATARMMVLRVQNRLIRFEMRLRLREVLPPALASRIPELTVRQLIGLRFAGDAELPALVQRTLNGEFANSREIKRAVTDWQPDYMRA